jgi:hypothetical protein
MAAIRLWLKTWKAVALGLLFFLLAGAAVIIVGETSIRATAEERARRCPGDQLITKALSSITHAITIRSTPHDVWPWLAQMGSGRAGWYSYDFVDNGGHASASRILPEFQKVEVGGIFPALPGVRDAFVVLQYETDRSLVLGWLPSGETTPVTTWAFVLEDLGSGRTRLIERGKVRSPYRPLGLPEWLSKRVAPVAHAVMVRKHMLGIAARSEGARADRRTPIRPPWIK